MYKTHTYNIVPELGLGYILLCRYGTNHSALFVSTWVLIGGGRL